MTVHRLQRWAITLLNYNYTIIFRRTEQHGNADALSRLPVGPDVNFDKTEMCNNLDEVMEASVDSFPLRRKDIQEASRKDPALLQVYNWVRHGWPETIPKSDSKCVFFNRRNALTVVNGLLVLQTEFTRIVIPPKCQARVLQLLHEGHWGVQRMKQIARRHCWWPTIDKDIERTAAQCAPCQQHMPLSKQEFHS